MRMRFHLGAAATITQSLHRKMRNRFAVQSVGGDFAAGMVELDVI
jgi:hypothetical protein